MEFSVGMDMLQKETMIHCQFKTNTAISLILIILLLTCIYQIFRFHFYLLN